MDNNETCTYLSFYLNGELFGVNVENVLNILEIKKIEHKHFASDYIIGTLHLRGRKIPVIDLKKKIGLPETNPTIESSIIIMMTGSENTNIRFGIIADSVSEVVEMDLCNKNTCLTNRGNHSELFQGILKNERNKLMILNIDKILNPNEIVFFSGFETNLNEA